VTACPPHPIPYPTVRYLQLVSKYICIFCTTTIRKRDPLLRDPSPSAHSPSGSEKRLLLSISSLKPSSRIGGPLRASMSGTSQPFRARTRPSLRKLDLLSLLALVPNSVFKWKRREGRAPESNKIPEQGGSRAVRRGNSERMGMRSIDDHVATVSMGTVTWGIYRERELTSGDGSARGTS
jgi:hypothetical protein